MADTHVERIDRLERQVAILQRELTEAREQLDAKEAKNELRFNRLVAQMDQTFQPQRVGAGMAEKSAKEPLAVSKVLGRKANVAG